MKFRSDFVTNSSSSSFICEVCGDVQSGWDMCLSEAGMVECVNGHTFCESEMVDGYTIDYTAEAVECAKSDFESGYELKYWKKEKETNDEFLDRLSKDECLAKRFYEDNMENSVPVEACPICTREHIRDHDLIKFAIDKLGITKKELTKLTREHLLEQDKKK